ncbi:MAG: hypothetical protein ACI85F_002452 [Bacteroidia bacterium]|jgi:hypothetical protein
MMLGAFVALAQQQVPNGSFEHWENSGKHMEPQGWNSLMSADMCTFCSMGASQRVFKERRGIPGKGGCIRIESSSVLGGIIVNGSVTTGRVTAPSLRPTDGYNRTVKADDEFNLRFTDRPDSLVFWAKYSITDNSDSALASFLLHGDSDMSDPSKFTKTAKPIGIAQMTFQTNSEWKRISIPFYYNDKFNRQSTYLLATFSSSFEAGNGNSTATLWIDDVELVYDRLSQASKTQPWLAGY